MIYDCDQHIGSLSFSAGTDALPAEIHAERQAAAPADQPAYTAYMNKFTCAGTHARCQIQGCSDGLLAQTRCRTVAFVKPKQGQMAQPWSNPTIEPMLIYLHTRYGELVTLPGTVGHWVLRQGATATSPIVDCGSFQLVGKRYAPVRATTPYPAGHECQGVSTSDGDYALAPGVVYRFEADMPAPSGGVLPREMVKIKR